MSRVVYLVAEVLWHHPHFARHPAGGIPLRLFRHRDAAEACCLRLNRNFQAGRCPFDHPPREVASRASAAWLRWDEDEPRLRVLIDYVQDLGLPAPPTDGPLRAAWVAWWRATRPAMEPAQWQAIWTFLDRRLPFRVSEVPCQE